MDSVLAHEYVLFLGSQGKAAMRLSLEQFQRLEESGYAIEKNNVQVILQSDVGNQFTVPDADKVLWLYDGNVPLMNANQPEPNQYYAFWNPMLLVPFIEPYGNAGLRFYGKEGIMAVFGTSIGLTHGDVVYQGGLLVDAQQRVAGLWQQFQQFCQTIIQVDAFDPHKALCNWNQESEFGSWAIANCSPRWKPFLEAKQFNMDWVGLWMLKQELDLLSILFTWPARGWFARDGEKLSLLAHRPTMRDIKTECPSLKQLFSTGTLDLVNKKLIEKALQCLDSWFVAECNAHRRWFGLSMSKESLTIKFEFLHNRGMRLLCHKLNRARPELAKDLHYPSNHVSEAYVEWERANAELETLLPFEDRLFKVESSGQGFAVVPLFSTEKPTHNRYLLDALDAAQWKNSVILEKGTVLGWINIKKSSDGFVLLSNVPDELNLEVVEQQTETFQQAREAAVKANGTLLAQAASQLSPWLVLTFEPPKLAYRWQLPQQLQHWLDQLNSPIDQLQAASVDNWSELVASVRPTVQLLKLLDTICQSERQQLTVHRTETQIGFSIGIPQEFEQFLKDASLLEIGHSFKEMMVYQDGHFDFPGGQDRRSATAVYHCKLNVFEQFCAMLTAQWELWPGPEHSLCGKGLIVLKREPLYSVECNGNQELCSKYSVASAVERQMENLE